MAKLKDLTGKQFNSLTVLERAYPNTDAGNARWKCKCLCGNQVVVVSYHLLNSSTSSCGCWRKKQWTVGNRSENENVVKLTYNDKSLSIKGWAKETGIGHRTIIGRLKTGWSVEKTLSTPARKYTKKVKPSWSQKAA